MSQLVDELKQKIAAASLPDELRENLTEEIDSLNLLEGKDFYSGHQNLLKYLNWALRIPWQAKSEDFFDTKVTRELLDQTHYGLSEIKERIIDLIAVLKLRKERGIEEKSSLGILCLVGLVGTGKTTICESIAAALKRKFIRIPFGGLGDPYYLRGKSKNYPEAEPGQIIKGLVNVAERNPVILLDEIDRVSDDALNTIMGVLVEVLDPEQNSRFIDHYLDYPVDLSEALFIATANNTQRIATAVLDRLEIVQMPSYTDEEKIAIGRDYILPKLMDQFGLTKSDLIIDDVCWQKIIRPLGFDSGVRSLKRTIEAFCRKAARALVENKGSTRVTPENLKEFISIW